ncbi:MAG: protein kinase [Pseudomonadota bacterium]
MTDTSPTGRRYCSHCGATFLTDLERCPKDGNRIVQAIRDPLLDQVLVGRYRVLACLGYGGMGQVYQVEHATIGKPFALKVLYGELAGDRKMVERFQREAFALSRLSHRNIVEVVDFGESEQGLLFLVTELIKGRSLVDEGPVLSVGQTVHVARQITRALHHAHRNGIVHRDLKPENVMLVEEEDDPVVVKILDFGIARVASEQAAARGEHLTAAGLMLGTPEYMAPEQARGKAVDGRADLYSLGVMLFELLTGSLPFESSNVLELMSMHLSAPPPSITTPGVPPALAEVVARLLAKKPEDRYQSALELQAALDATLGPSALAAARRRTGLGGVGAAATAPIPAVQAASTSTVTDGTSDEAAKTPKDTEAQAHRDTEAAQETRAPAEAGTSAGRGIETEAQEAGEARSAKEGLSQTIPLAEEAAAPGAGVMEAGSEKQAEQTEQTEHPGQPDQSARPGVDTLGRPPTEGADGSPSGEQTGQEAGAAGQTLAAVPGTLADAMKGASTRRSPLAGPQWQGRGNTEWQVGQVIDERWEVFGWAAGSSGVVMFVRDRVWDGMALAVKTFRHPAGKEGEASKTRLRQRLKEWRDLGEYSHLVAGFYELEIQAALRFFMQYVPGKPLSQLFREISGKPIPLENALDLAVQAASALEFLHARQMVHGGLEPKRCLTTDDLLLRLALPLKPEETRPHSDEQALYLAPECWDEKRGQSQKGASDVYSMGAILYQAIAGFPPFEASAACAERYAGKLPNSLGELLAAAKPDARSALGLFHQQVEPLPLATSGPLAELVLRCLAKDPAQRPSAASFRSAILGLYPTVVGSDYDRELVLPDSSATEAGECNRAASYYTMGDTETAKQILDKWLSRDRAPLSAWLNRKAIAINEEEVQPGTVFEQMESMLAARGQQAEDDRHASLFKEHMAAYVILVGAPVRAVAFSPDSSLVATGSDSPEETARVWETATGKLSTVMRWTRDKTVAVAFSPDGRRLVTGSDYGAVRLWNASSGELVRTISEHWGRVTSVVFSPDGNLLLTGGRDGTARLIDVANGKLVGTLKGHNGPVNSVAFAPDGRRVLTGGGDAAVRMWDVVSGKPLGELKGQFQRISSVAISPDGRSAIAGGEGGMAWVCDLASGRVTVVLKGHRGAIHSAAIRLGGRMALTGSADFSALLWDVASGRPERSLMGHTAAVLAVGFSPNGTMAITGSEDCTARMWVVGGAHKPDRAWPVCAQPPRSAERSTPQQAPLYELSARLRAHDISAYPGLKAAIRTVPKRPDQEELALDTEQACASFGLRTGVRAALRLSTGKVNAKVESVGFSSSGRFVLVAAGREASLREVKGWKLIRSFGSGTQINAAAISSDGRIVATAYGDERLHVWDAGSGSLRREIFAPIPVNKVALCHDGSRVISSHDDRTVRIWDARAGKLLHACAGHRKPARPVAWFPGGELAISGADDGRALIWDTSQGAASRALDGHGDEICAVAVSADGRFAVTGSADRTARLWETAHGKTIRVFRHSGEVASVSLSPDGRLLLTATGGRAVTVWDTKTGNAYCTVAGESNAVSVAAFCPDVASLATGGESGTCELWVLDSDWVFFEEALYAGASLLDGQPSRFWQHIKNIGADLDGCLDVWQDLKNCAKRSNLAPEWPERLGAVRSSIIGILARLVEAAAADPAVAATMAGHTVPRAHQVDPELARDIPLPKAKASPEAVANPESSAATPASTPVAPLPVRHEEMAVRPSRGTAAYRASSVTVWKPWKHLSLSVLGLGPGIALVTIGGGPATLAVGALAIAGGIWQGLNFANALRKPKKPKPPA